MDTVLRRAEPAAERYRGLAVDRDSDLSGAKGRRDPVEANPAVSRDRLADLLFRVCPGGKHPADEEALAGRRHGQIRGIHPQSSAGRMCRRRPFGPQEQHDRTWTRRCELRREIDVLQSEAAFIVNERPLDRSSGVMRRCTGQARKEDVFGCGRATRSLGPTRRDQEHKHEGQPRDALGAHTAQPGTLAHGQQRYSGRSRDASSISTTSPSRSGRSCGDGRIRTSERVSPL